jgi:hypothetical protein
MSRHIDEVGTTVMSQVTARETKHSSRLECHYQLVYITGHATGPDSPAPEARDKAALSHNWPLF